MADEPHESELSARQLRYIIDHVFLPPQIYQQEDDDTTSNKTKLLSALLEALRSWLFRLPYEERSVWSPCFEMIKVLMDLQGSSPALDLESLRVELENLSIGGILALQIRAQNAGLMIRKRPYDTLFETFELSPTTNAVMNCKSRLLRSFPGPAIRVPNATVADPAFRDPLVEMLVKLDSHTPTQAESTTSKAKSEVNESRQTVHPMMVTSLLTGILRASGQPAEVHRIQKRTRDDVLWKDARDPWRRSPLWLLVRVALQSALAQIDEEGGSRQYKSFMIFFATSILKKALSGNVSNDLLSVMKAKICRRISKLNTTAIAPYVQEVLQSTQDRLQKVWDGLQDNKDPNDIWSDWNLCNANISFEKDTRLALKSLRPYLTSMANRQLHSSGHDYFQPQYLIRIPLSELKVPSLEYLPSSDSHQKNILLSDFECWVATCLPTWLEHNISVQNTTRILAGLIGQYVDTACTVYHNNPVLQSTMFLSLMELWAAMDKSVLVQHPIVADYSIGFPAGLLDPLLLPSKEQMMRLSAVEQYIITRNARAELGPDFDFLSIGRKSLPVRYFESSTSHQRLRHDIETMATRMIAEKLDELEQEKSRYKNLSETVASMNCNNSTVWRGTYQISQHVSDRCTRCSLESEMESMVIYRYERPLPSDEVQAKIVVFELDVPGAIQEWRDVTYRLLVETLAAPDNPSPYDTPQPTLYWLRGYADLKAHRAGALGRLQLGSEIKSFSVAHYRTGKVSGMTKAQMIVNHGMRYNICDSEHERGASSSIGLCNIRSRCTFKLPEGPYQKLEDTLMSTSHTSNEIIARQSECPPNLTLHEFYAFGSLRAGHRLQWINVARALVENVLSFNQQEVCLLFLQSCLQAGPAGTPGSLRESHEILQQRHICLDLLDALDNSLSSIEGNWQGMTSARTFIVLASRIYSLSDDGNVKIESLRFTRRIRSVVLGWKHELEGKLQDSMSETEREDLRSRCLETALICYLTFGSNGEYVPSLLSSQADISDVLNCSIAIRDNCPADETGLMYATRHILHESVRLSHRLEDHIRSLVLADSRGIDRAIGSIWRGYRPRGSWSPVQESDRHWLMTRTESASFHTSTAVHLNVLTGELLVNGKPLSRLPMQYESHSTFRRVFGSKILDVVPSSRGLDFEVRGSVEGHQVHLKMSQSELILQAIDQDGQVLELVPTHALHGDFPTRFIEDYVHWCHVDTGVLEWRSLTSPWTPEQHSWKLLHETQDSGTQDIYRLRNGNKVLIDISSLTGRALSSLLSPLERESYVHSIFNAGSLDVAVSLPRLNLDFNLDRDMTTLKSKQFRGMIVDPDQAIGTLVGLKNKLILRTSGNSPGHDRCALVPFGELKCSRSREHVIVNVHTGDDRQVSYYRFDVDPVLQKLSGNVTLRGALFKTLLNALTSYCLPDRLTERTGTEEALACMKGAAIRSFKALSDQEHRLLTRIGSLTPQRTWYPKGMRLMQTISWAKLWANLSPHSQHNQFAMEANNIIHHYAKFGFLGESSGSVWPMKEISLEFHLWERAAIRDAPNRLDGFGGEVYNTKHDVVYQARDRCFADPGEERSHAAARLASDWTVDLNCGFNIWSYLKSFGHSPINGLAGSSHPRHKMIQKLGFDETWLDSARDEESLPDPWCALQSRLSSAIQSQDKYRIGFFLATLTFSECNPDKLVKTLLAFATNPQLRQLRPPTHEVFEITKGCEPCEVELIEIAKKHKVELENSPLSFHTPHESYEDWRRRQNQYSNNVEQKARRFTAALIPQWRVPFGNSAALAISPGDDIWTYILATDAIKESREKFRRWAQNKELQQYADKAQEILDHLGTTTYIVDSYTFSTSTPIIDENDGLIRYHDLFQVPAPVLEIAPEPPFWDHLLRNPSHDRELHIKKLLKHLESKHAFEQDYARDLQRSLDSIDGSDRLPEFCGSQEALSIALSESHQYETQCSQHVRTIHDQISTAMKASVNSIEAFNDIADLLPRLSRSSLLQYLASPRRRLIKTRWKRILVQYGIALTALQRATRLLKAIRGSLENNVDLVKEITNPGHENWDPNDHPDWLLLEVESNLLIRPVQARIAEAMITPSSGHNSIMQLNMGEGKSSVIVPIIAAYLADTSKLARVVVLKPLSPQMLNTLISKCSGLLSRPVYYIPFSRSLQLSSQQAVRIRELYEECMHVGGILLTR